nr:2'-5' RNA ligase family protein [Kineococcus vitellinus]
MEEAAAQELDALRRRWFPPERNQLSAHVTMFHALPGEELPEVLDAVREACRRPAFDVRVTGLRSLGRGVALVLRAPELDAVRARIAAAFAGRLGRQDAQGFRPHVTVANFLPPERARELLARLEADFSPWSARARGVAVHRYLGGPWEQVAEQLFDA